MGLIKNFEEMHLNTAFCSSEVGKIFNGFQLKLDPIVKRCIYVPANNIIKDHLNWFSTRIFRLIFLVVNFEIITDETIEKKVCLEIDRVSLEISKFHEQFQSFDSILKRKENRELIIDENLENAQITEDLKPIFNISFYEELIENFVKIRSIYSSLGNKKIVANCDEFINFSKSFRSFFKILNQKKEKFEQNKMYMGTLVEALDLMNLKARFNTIQEIVMNLTEQSLFMENETEQNLFMENADEYYSLILVNVNNNKMLIDEILNKIKLTDVLYKKVIGELNADIDLAIKEILTFKKDLLNKIYLDERIILVFDLYVSKLKEKQRCIKILSSENKTDCCPPSFDDDLIDGASLPPSFDDNLIDDLLNENKIKELNQRIIDNFVDKNTPERNLKTNPNIKRISDSSEFEDFLKEVKNLITDINNIENTFEKKTLAYRLFTYFNQSIHLSASLVEDESKREGIKGSSEEPVYLPTVEAAVFYQENKSKLFEIELIDYSFRTLVELIKSNSESLKKIILDADLIVDV